MSIKKEVKCRYTTNEKLKYKTTTYLDQNLKKIPNSFITTYD